MSETTTNITRVGFETRIDGPFGEGQRWIEVAPPGATTTIALVSSQDGIEVSLATEDADADHADLREPGVEADAERLTSGGGAVVSLGWCRSPPPRPLTSSRLELA